MKRMGQDIRNKYRIIFALFMVMAVVHPKAAIRAETTARVCSAATAEDAIYIYVKGINNIGEDSVIQIGTDICAADDVTVRKLKDMEVPMRTIILLDNSKSVPSANHGDIQTIIAEVIGQGLPNEQFKIGTFSDKVTYLCDYTTDRNVALACAGEIEYLNQNTYFSDCLYEVLSQLKAENDFYYTRIIMISDGADDNEIGYTNAEVRELAGACGIPLYTVGVKAKNNNRELENMFAFSRASGAEYYLLDGNTTAENIVAGLGEDRENICICIYPQPQLMDGSNKKVLLKLLTDAGEIKLTTEADMPFAAAPVQQNTEAVPAEKTETVQEPEIPLPTAGTAKTDTAKAEKEQKENVTTGTIPGIAIMIIAISAAVIIAAAAAIFIRRKKKTEPIAEEEPAFDGISDKTEPVLEEEERTELVAEGAGDGSERTMIDSPDGGNQTLQLWEDAPRAAYIVLRSRDNPQVMYKVPIRDAVRIGRSDADIVIDDGYVSAKHCDLILRENKLYMKDLGSSNGTYYRGSKINGEVSIESGEKIRVGHSDFTVELIRE